MAYRPDGGIRDRHIKYMQERYRALLPGSEIIVSTDVSGVGWDSFNKSKMLNAGVRKSTKDYVLITDIDVVLQKCNILSALSVAAKCSVVYLFDRIYMVNEQTTKKILRDNPANRIDVNPTQYKELKRGGDKPNGIHLLSKEHYWKAGGYDERFVGWGSEDSCFLKAARTMIDLPSKRIEGVAYHLWHPVDPMRAAKRDESEIKNKYISQYKEALGNKEIMEKILWKQ
jgi:hypothetical protein